MLQPIASVYKESQFSIHQLAQAHPDEAQLTALDAYPLKERKEGAVLLFFVLYQPKMSLSQIVTFHPTSTLPSHLYLCDELRWLYFFMLWIIHPSRSKRTESFIVVNKGCWKDQEENAFEFTTGEITCYVLWWSFLVLVNTGLHERSTALMTR